MSIKKTSEEICDEYFKALTSSNNVDGFKLIHSIYNVYLKKEKRIFFILLEICKNPKYIFQYMSGEILFEYKIPCEITLREFLEEVIPNYNLSIKSTVFYLKEQFGQDSLLDEIKDLMQSHTSSSETFLKLETMMYHMGIATK